jgi:CRISPR-associated endonuclease/helicase Cas3
MIAKRQCKNDKIYYQSFLGHTEDSLKILRFYLENKYCILKSFCKRWELKEDTFIEDLFLTVAFHDIGKLTKEFQTNIQQGKFSRECPHTFFSLPIVSLLPFHKYEDIPLAILAILGHHTQLHRNIYDNNSISDTKKVNYEVEEILNFSKNTVRNLYNKLNFISFFAIPEIDVSKTENISAKTIREKYIISYIENTIEYGDRVKSIFTYLFSILQLCDDYSSANFSSFIEQNNNELTLYDSVLTNSEKYVYDYICSEEDFKNILFRDHDLHVFQNEFADNKDIYSFLFAPCGRGKTEAALWWAYHIKNNQNCDRIIFALPTQTTCNAMYDRFIKYFKFDEKFVGLFHGKSFIKLNSERKEENIIDNEIEEDEIRGFDDLKDDNFKGKIFFKPFTITTIDHLAYAFVHGFSQSDFACGNLQNSIIIFDEIHYYEQHTLNVLFAVFKKLRSMHIPHLLMTGTAPEFILEETEAYSLTLDLAGLELEPFSIIKQDKDITINEESVYDQIFSDYKEGKKIFIILNQVEWAQNFYSDLKDYFLKSGSLQMPKMLLYHSRFIYSDRIKKEEKIKILSEKNEPFILIATQVIEISLNISSDVMYSQIAPPDTIGQRAGRLNRSGKSFKNKYINELKLFYLDKYRPYDKELIEKCWTDLKNGPTSYNDIKKVCDSVYKNREIIPYNRYFHFFDNNILFGNRPSEIVYSEEEGNALKIRDSEFHTIEVIPGEFKDQLLDKKRSLISSKCTIPYYYYISNPNLFQIENTTFKESVIFCYFPYSPEKGLERADKKKFEERML